MVDGYLNINNNILGKFPVSNEFNSDNINQVDLIIIENGEFDEILIVIDILILIDFNLTHHEVLLIDPDFSLTEDAYNNYQV